MAQQQAPYGSWKSPITADLITRGSVSFETLMLDGEDLYWLEVRPSEEGRYVVVRRTPDGETSDVTAAGYNVRSRVHEYGGGEFTVSRGTLVFSNFNDNRLYRQDIQAPHPITPEGKMRYADMVVDRKRDLVFCVREDHSAEGKEATNSIVKLQLQDESEGEVIVSGNDFYSTPRVSPDGSRLLWLTWNHPNMPWDGTELWVADLSEDGSITDARQVAGAKDESIFNPQWSPDGVLYFISDRSGWWNLYREGADGTEAVCPMEAEFGRPQWVFGMNMYDFQGSDTIVCTYQQAGATHIATIDTVGLVLKPIETKYTEVWDIHTAPGFAYFLGGMANEPWAVVRLDLQLGDTMVLRSAEAPQIDIGYFSVPQPIEFPTEKGLTSHAFFYPPTNKDYTGSEGAKPPLLVFIHGGPTSSTSSAFDLSTQYWTSRGFAIVDVDYGGSTGYGREYRRRLNGQWGVVDVNDAVNAVRYLAEQGLIDPERTAIRGGSAGGYTTLLALTKTDTFKAGASYFGISDMVTFVQDTHKFESRYLDSMLGPLPDSIEVYKERSALNYLDNLSAPVIFLQGLDDKVVPPNQATLMVDALRKKGLPVAHIEFEGEGHGFRKSETIKRALEAEFYFYSRVFGFQPADDLEPVEIENLAG